MSPAPAVSIVMPSYNHGRYIGLALEGILGQTFTDFELIVVDYASQDETWDILRSLDDPRVRAVEFPVPGMGRALNHGMGLARGSLLTWVHTDNIPYADWLQTLVDELAAHPETDFVYSDFEVIDAAGKTVEVMRYGPFEPDRLLAYCLVGSTFLYRRRVYEALGDYLEDHPRDDHEYWLRAWQKGFVFRNVPVNLGRGRLHEDTRMTRMREEYDASLRDLIADHIHLAQGRGVELFRVRDRTPADLEEFSRAVGRMERRLAYFLDFFTHARGGMKLAVLGDGPLERLVLDILRNRTADLAVLDAAPRPGGPPALPAEEFLARGFDFVFICGFDPGGRIRAGLVSRGVPRQRAVSLFLDQDQAPR